MHSRFNAAAAVTIAKKIIVITLALIVVSALRNELFVVAVAPLSVYGLTVCVCVELSHRHTEHVKRPDSIVVMYYVNGNGNDHDNDFLFSLSSLLSTVISFLRLRSSTFNRTFLSTSLAVIVLLFFCSRFVCCAVLRFGLLVLGST